MFILHESIWWNLAMGVVGWYIGYLRGLARWGLLLGLLLGPLGWGITLFLPAARVRGGFRPFSAGADARAGSSGPACPRCGKGVGPGDKACGHCGNLLIPIQYRVIGASGTQ